MIIRSTSEQQTHASQWKNYMLYRTYRIFSPRTAKGLNSTPTPLAGSERQFVMQGFMLAILSLFCSFFPVCGLPIAISGLIIGVTGYRAGHLHKLTTLTIIFSTIGLALTLINVFVSISIYFSF